MPCKDELTNCAGRLLVALVADDGFALGQAMANLCAAVVFTVEVKGMDPAELDKRVLDRLAVLRATYAAEDQTQGKLPLEPVKYSADWLRAEVARRGGTTLDADKCSACGHVRFYSFVGTDVWSHASCFCANRAPEPSNYEEIAGFLSLLPDDASRDRIMARLT